MQLRDGCRSTAMGEPTSAVLLDLSATAVEQQVGGRRLHILWLLLGHIAVIEVGPALALHVAERGVVPPAQAPIVVADRVQIIHWGHSLRQLTSNSAAVLAAGAVHV